MNNISAIVLAAGKGTRMGSDKPKVLHEIGGKPMIEYTLDKLNQLGLLEIILVVGHGGDEVKTCIGPRCHFAIQENPKGTGDAVKVGLKKVNPKCDTVLVLNGDDSAFYNTETLRNFVNFHNKSGNPLSVITVSKSQEEKLGRIMRSEDGMFVQALEDEQYRESGLYTDEVNSGTYLFDRRWLEKYINKINNRNEKGEYRINETLNIAKQEAEDVGLFKLDNTSEWIGINTMDDLEKANKLMEAK